MDLAELDQATREALTRARESLGRIEMEVRERGEDDPEMMRASRILAQFCMHARDFVQGVALRRPAPRRFADRLDALAVEMSGVQWPAGSAPPTPDAAHLGQLARDARTVPGTL